MHGGADWTVSVALVERGRPIAAALYAPVTDELFVAVTGGGTTRNAQPVTALDAPPRWRGSGSTDRCRSSTG